MVEGGGGRSLCREVLEEVEVKVGDSRVRTERREPKVRKIHVVHRTVVWSGHFHQTRVGLRSGKTLRTRDATGSKGRGLDPKGRGSYRTLTLPDRRIRLEDDLVLSCPEYPKDEYSECPECITVPKLFTNTLLIVVERELTKSNML